MVIYVIIWIFRLCVFSEGEGNGEVYGEGESETEPEAETEGSRMHCYRAAVECSCRL